VGGVESGEDGGKETASRNSSQASCVKQRSSSAQVKEDLRVTMRACAKR